MESTKEGGVAAGPEATKVSVKEGEDPQRTGLPCNGSRYTVTHSHAITT